MNITKINNIQYRTFFTSSQKEKVKASDDLSKQNKHSETAKKYLIGATVLATTIAFGIIAHKNNWWKKGAKVLEEQKPHSIKSQTNTAVHVKNAEQEITPPKNIAETANKMHEENVSEIKKNELNQNNLTQKLNNYTFKDALNIEEAKAFAFEKLGVESYDFGNNLEIMNWVNEALFNIKIMSKDTAQLPKKIALMPQDTAKDIKAGIVYKSDFNEIKEDLGLKVNPKYFENIDDVIQRQISDFKKVFLLYKDENGKYVFNHVMNGVNPDYENILNKYLEDSTKLSLKDKISLSETNIVIIDKNNRYYTYVNELFNDWSSNPKIKKYAQDNYIDLTYIDNLNEEDKFDKYVEIIQSMLSKGINPYEEIKLVNPFKCLYHEIGHYNHMNTELFIKLSVPKSMFKELNLPLPLIANEFESNKDIEKLALRVSYYAKESPLEFVAEVYANVLCGKRYPKEIMDLYAKCNGPDLSAFLI